MSSDQSHGTVNLRKSLIGWSLYSKDMAYDTMTGWTRAMKYLIVRLVLLAGVGESLMA